MKHLIITRKANIEGDYYGTPPEIVRGIISKINLSGFIWEPCCGSGNISRLLIDSGHKVFSSDLYDRGYGKMEDFFKSDRKSDIIITNPPFNMIDNFVKKAKKQAHKKIIIVASQNFLHGKKRIYGLLNDLHYPISKILLVDIKLSFFKNGLPPLKRTGFMPSCVVVFEKGYKGDINMDWIHV